MANWQLPQDLEWLERRLVQQPREEPSVALRGRVMAGVQTALRPQRFSVWQMLAAAAAGIMIWLNLALSATNATGGALRPSDTPESVDRLARQIERLLPDLPCGEARQYAIRYRSGSELVPCPEVSARPKCNWVPTGWPG